MYQEKTWFAREKIKNIFDELTNEKSEDKRDSSTIDYWHYTSTKAILSIFKDFIESSDEEIKTCNIYASHNRFLNDSQEYEDGKNILIDLVDKYNRESRTTKIDKAAASTDANAYIVSFCTDGDLLSQWKWYGGQSGVSFCLNASDAVFSTITDKDGDGKETPSFPDYFTKPLPVYYYKDDKRQYFYKLVNEVLVKKDKSLDENKIDLLPDLFIPFCKNESFYEEKEHRLVFFDFCDLKNSEDIKREFNYKYNDASNGVIKPALNVKVNLDESVKNKCLITKMIVGPGSNQHLIFNALIHIFDRNHFRFVPDMNVDDFSIRDSFFEDKVPADGKQHLVKIRQKKPTDPKHTTTIYKVAYRCHNGLLIMKSAIPFRG